MDEDAEYGDVADEVEDGADDVETVDVEAGAGVLWRPDFRACLT